MGAFAWFGQLMEHLMAFIPLPIIVRTDEAMVEWVLGKYPRCFHGGWYIQWDLLAAYEILHISRDTEEISAEFSVDNFTSGRNVAINAILVYEVCDPLKLATTSREYDSTIKDVASIALRNVLAPNGLFLPERLHEQRLSAILKKRADSKLKHYGVKVLEFTWTSAPNQRSISLWMKGNE